MLNGDGCVLAGAVHCTRGGPIGILLLFLFVELGEQRQPFSFLMFFGSGRR